MIKRQCDCVGCMGIIRLQIKNLSSVVLGVNAEKVCEVLISFALRFPYHF